MRRLDLVVDLDTQFLLDLLRVRAEQQDLDALVIQQSRIVDFDPASGAELRDNLRWKVSGLFPCRDARQLNLGILHGYDVARRLPDLELGLCRPRFPRQLEDVASSL